MNFDKYLTNKLKKAVFKKRYEEEKELVELAVRLQKAREKAGKSQGDIAHEACLTQQQLSRVESGAPCNIRTFIKACHANGFKLDLKSVKRRKAA
jgi:ribosome-binding protein aMBF1 (putative translation factor)